MADSDARQPQSLPNSLLIVTLASNFGTFLLYMLTNIVAIVAFREHHSFSGFKHMVVPVFGLLANLVCMVFYLVGPFFVNGMTESEPYIALGVALAWGYLWLALLHLASKKKGRSAMLTAEAKAAGIAAGWLRVISPLAVDCGGQRRIIPFGKS